MDQKIEMALRLAKEGRQEGFRFLREQTYPDLMQKAMGVVGDEQVANRVVEQAYNQVFSQIGGVTQATQFEQWLTDMVVYFANQECAPLQPRAAQTPSNVQPVKVGFFHTTGGLVTLIVLIIAVIGGIVAMLVISGRNKKESQAEPTKTDAASEAVTEETTAAQAVSEITTEVTTEEVVEETVDYASVYLAILQRESSAINNYNQYRHELGEDWTSDLASNAPIAIRDITGDDVPELIFVKCQASDTNYISDLYIYTVEHGAEKQILYVNNWDVQVAGGSTYSLFQLEGDSTLYASNGMCDDFTEEYYYRYDVQDNGNLTSKMIMSRYRTPGSDINVWNTKCTVDSASVSEEAFQSELDTLMSKVGTVLLYNSNPFDEGATQALKRAEQAYMTYDEAISYLNGLNVAAPEQPADNQDETIGDKTEMVLPFSEPQSLIFSSGVGGWSTGIVINPDGTFAGNYSDSDMGDSGPDYAATVYVCSFSGAFGNIKKIDDYTYELELVELQIEETPGDEWIEEMEGTNIRYISAGPYGIEGGKTFQLYLPGKPVSILPEAYVGWVYGLSEKTQLSGYGLYNVDMEEGFSQEY